MGGGGLTTTNSNDNFQLIRIGKLNRCMLASGYDLSVAFDRNTLSGKFKLLKQR